MIHVKRVDEERWGASAGQCGCYLGSYVSAFAYAGYNDLAFAVINQFYSTVKLLVKLRH